MHRHAFKHLALGAAFTLGAAAAQAADDAITTTISGYGTVAGTVTDDPDAQYISALTQHKGATNRTDIGVLSRLGLQGVVKFGPEFSFTAQALATRRALKDFDVGAEWLYGQYTPFAGLDLRLGRVALPTFLLSDTRNVGYAAPWLAAPTEVYSPMPFASLDGLQGLWKINAGPATVSTQLSYGSSSALVYTAAGILDVKGRDVASASVAVEAGDWTVRVAHNQLISPVSLTIAPGVTLNHIAKDKFESAGLQYDNGTALVMAEWDRRKQNDVPALGMPLAGSTAWYAAAGWRFGKLTPMVRYVSIKASDSLTAFPKEPSYGASLRYDIVRNVALKVQIDQYDASSAYSFLAPKATAGDKIKVVSFGADFVF